MTIYGIVQGDELARSQLRMASARSDGTISEAHYPAQQRCIESLANAMLCFHLVQFCMRRLAVSGWLSEMPDLMPVYNAMHWRHHQRSRIQALSLDRPQQRDSYPK